MMEGANDLDKAGAPSRPWISLVQSRQEITTPSVHRIFSSFHLPICCAPYLCYPLPLLCIQPYSLTYAMLCYAMLCYAVHPNPRRRIYKWCIVLSSYITFISALLSPCISPPTPKCQKKSRKMSTCVKHGRPPLLGLVYSGLVYHVDVVFVIRKEVQGVVILVRGKFAVLISDCRKNEMLGRMIEGLETLVLEARWWWWW